MLFILLSACSSAPVTDSPPAVDSTTDTAPPDTNTPDTAPPDTNTPDTGQPEACGPEGSPGAASPPLLSAAALLADAAPDAPLDSAAFVAADGADDPLHTLEGWLTITPGAGARTVYHAEYWLTEDDQQAPLPEISGEFVQCGRDLLPTARGRQLTDDAYWDILLSPGRIWSNPHDAGRSRVALPFALSLKSVNCVFNGMLTFLYDGTTTSQVRWQVTQETCHLMKLDAWGQGAATVVPGVGAAAEVARSDFIAERAARPEVRPFAQLAVDHPGVDLSALDAGLSLPDLSARGLLVDDVLYLDTCRTRHGDHPFCADLILPSFSLAKTAYTSLGLAAMAQEFDADPYARTLSELLGADGSWGAVTVENLLDMSTGHYLVDTQADPDVPGFYGSLDLAGRLDATFALPQRSAPGERVVYLTPNSQVAAAAMDAHLADVGASETDSFAYVVDRVLRPAGVTPDSFQSLRTWEDGGQNNGTGFGGYGMWFTPHGITALGAFMQRGGDGVLHPERLAETLFQTDDYGAQMSYYSYRYNNGMWGYPITGCDQRVPILFGINGITVLLAPNGLVYFAFTDSQSYPVSSVLTQLDAIRPLCE